MNQATHKKETQSLRSELSLYSLSTEATLSELFLGHPYLFMATAIKTNKAIRKKHINKTDLRPDPLWGGHVELRGLDSQINMSVDDRVPLLRDQQEQREDLPRLTRQAFDDCSTRLSTFSEHLGIRVDAFSSSSGPAGSTNSSRGPSERQRDEPILVVTQDKVENLIMTLEKTAEALKRLVLDSQGLLPKTRQGKNRDV